MAEQIKGLSVKIGADTSDFIKGLKRVDKEINQTTKQANELQKGLELEFDESRFIEAQRLIQSSLDSTQEKAKAIREELKFLEDSGNIDTEGYKRLQTELYKTENQAILLEKKLEDIGKTNKKTVGSLINDFKGLATNMSSATAAVVAVGAATLKLVKDTTKQADEIATLAVKYNQSTDAIQRWNYIAMQSDVDANVLYKSMQKLNSAFSEQSRGEINASTTALAELGINIENFDNYDDAFNATIVAISSLKDVTQQTYYANKIFGEQVGTNLIPLFQQGTEALSAYNQEFEASGSLTEEQIKDLSVLDNKLNSINTRFKNMAYQLGSSLMPIVEVVFDFLETSVIPVLDFIMELLNPIIEALSWIVNLMGKLNKFAIDATATVFGKGWLWGKEDKNKASDTASSVNNNNIFSGYTIPSNVSNASVYNEDNSTYNVDLTVNSTGNLDYDSRQLADEVIKQIAIKKQASGR